MSAILNISSICLGLLSWFVPVLSLKYRSRRIRFSAVSFLCCALAMLLQLAEVNHRVGIGDLAAVMDTIHAVTFAGGAMLAICVIVNLVVHFLHSK